MLGTRLLSLAISWSLASAAAHASVDLIAIGDISGTCEDLAAQTVTPLENGIPGSGKR